MALAVAFLEPLLAWTLGRPLTTLFRRLTDAGTEKQCQLQHSEQTALGAGRKASASCSFTNYFGRVTQTSSATMSWDSAHSVIVVSFSHSKSALMKALLCNKAAPPEEPRYKDCLANGYLLPVHLLPPLDKRQRISPVSFDKGRRARIRAIGMPPERCFVRRWRSR